MFSFTINYESALTLPIIQLPAKGKTIKAITNHFLGHNSSRIEGYILYTGQAEGLKPDRFG